MKGTDLLNNLLGLLLRFRENKVAISAFVSKMYHRVIILEQEQHVRRYRWRNLENDQKPNAFVKTVMTFG